MDVSSPILWAAWVLFGVLVSLVAARLLRAAVTTPAGTAEAAPVRDPGEPWLYCEEGAPLDRETRWFRVRPAGNTVLGGRPRSATADTTYTYLAAHDVAEDHAVIYFDPADGRYHLRGPAGAPVRHNNEELLPGTGAVLTDGDTLDLGSQSRFRFTMTGPEEQP
jgi:hypothetical protein